MTNYFDLRDNVLRTIEEVNGYPAWKIEDLLREAEKEGVEIRAKWMDLTFELCEDKKYCKLLNAERLIDDDLERIKACAYVLIKKDEKIVLPFI